MGVISNELMGIIKQLISGGVPPCRNDLECGLIVLEIPNSSSHVKQKSIARVGNCPPSESCWVFLSACSKPRFLKRCSEGGRVAAITSRCSAIHTMG